MRQQIVRHGAAAVVALHALLAPAAGAQTGAPATDPQVVAGETGRRMDEFLSRQAAFGFSGQVLVARGRDVLLHRAYGWADRERRRPLTTGTRVGIASASKQFTAAAILRLEQEGRLSLRDSLGQHLPGVPADKRGITLRMLLTHTSGIRGGFTEDFDVASADSSIARLLGAPLTGQPGSAWRYSSDAYNLLAAVAERVSGAPFERYVETALFRPAGMRSSGFWWQLRGDTGAVAHAYRGWRDRGSPALWPRNWRVTGSGDVVTTAADLYAWHRALTAGRVLGRRTLARYLAPQVPIPESGGLSYGYGLFFGTSERGGAFYEHGGDTELGFNAAFYRYPSTDGVVIVVSNARDHGGTSARQFVQAQLEAMLFGADSLPLPPAARPFTAGELAALAGSYALAGGGTLHLVSDGALLWAAGEGQAGLDLFNPREGGEGARRAGERTRALLEGLLARDLAAFDLALTDSGAVHRAGYVAEWRELLAKEGPLHRFEVVGSARSGSALVTFARLHFLQGSRTMSFRWPNEALGRLSGTSVPAPSFPWAYPAARGAGDELIVHDPFRGRTIARLRGRPDGSLLVERDGMRLETGPVRRTGWVPR
ncbi:MAG TPA: serine hydrolase domain-containing protein [Longimicrobiaceae bacterium]|nr:serine hydrolase domain-containing protein [Longimicrobiaceae bacterium]